jgi:fructose-1,6-bisphosphatase I
MTSSQSPAAAAGSESLDVFLTAWAAAGEGREGLARTVAGLAGAGVALSDIIAAGPLSGALGSEIGARTADGDAQRQLDVIADRLIVDALRKTPTAYYASQEEEAILTLDPAGEFAVACDPLDGAANIDCNMPIATIFGVFRATPGDATASFFRKGEEQVAAGYVIYGAQTALLLTLGDGVAQFTLDPSSRKFVLASRHVRIAAAAREYAINASNYRHWPDQIRSFIDDCVEGESGPHGKDFNMHWLACTVAEAHRIFSRGGVFLYPGDDRPGHQQGRLRLLYEAFPIAMLVEQAGGAATDGMERILAKKLDKVHQRTALIFGSAEKVARIAKYYSDTDLNRAQSPLFGERGLFHN